MQPSALALLVLLLGLAGGGTAAAQAPAGPGPAVLRLTLEDAVRMALEHNPSLAVDRLTPQITDMEVAQANSAFVPTVNSVLQRRGQLSPPTNFLVGAEGTRTDTYTTSVGMAQRLPWAGTIYNLNWDSARESTNSFLNNFNPTLRSGINFSIAQPLLRDFSIDAARRQLQTTRLDRTISGVGFRENTVQIVAAAKRAYWDLVSARASVEVQERSLDLSRELVRMNQGASTWATRRRSTWSRRRPRSRSARRR
jgi:outer membrane protein TolC